MMKKSNFFTIFIFCCAFSAQAECGKLPITMTKPQNRTLLQAHLQSADPNDNFTEKGFEYKKDGDAGWTKVTLDNSAPFDTTLRNLTDGKYYFRAYAEKDCGTAYSDRRVLYVHCGGCKVPQLPAPVSPAAPASCGITPSAGNATTFTAKADPAAEKYEFFVNDVSRGKQSGNVLTLGSAVAASAVKVQYLYPEAYLKPKMLDIPGAASGTWYYNTPASGGTGSVANVAMSAFKMSETPVTQAQYEYVMGGNPSLLSCNGSGKSYVSSRPTSALPAEQVSFFDAMIYCNKLSKLEGRTPCYSIQAGGTVSYTADELAEFVFQDSRIPTSTTSPSADIYNAWRDNMVCDFSANGYRLPTETEWEYAARGGASNAHPVFAGSYYTGDYSTTAGSDSLCLVAWFTGNQNTATTCGSASNIYGTKDVKTKRANVFGLYDMTGNVYEWGWGYNGTFPSATPTVATVHPNGSLRALRGGYWNGYASSWCVSSRFISDPYLRNGAYGLRVVLSSL